MNDDDISNKGFAWRDLLGQDKWSPFTVTFTSLTTVGATTFTGRFRRVGRSIDFQVQASAATSIASTAGTTYLALPTTAAGVAGDGTMTNRTTNVAVGVCVIDVTNSRCYIPSQIASGNTFNICGRYES